MNWKVYLFPIAHKIRRIYWRIFKPKIMGCRVVVWRGPADNREVLLLRMSYVKGWHLPGGGVDNGESFQAAAHRELLEESGLRAENSTLHGIFLNTQDGARDHVAVYVVENFAGELFSKPTGEILENRFFSLKNLPPDISKAHLRRLEELQGLREKGGSW